MNDKQAVKIGIECIKQKMSPLYHYVTDYEAHGRYFSDAHEAAYKRWHKYNNAIKRLEAMYIQDRLPI